MKVLSKPPYNAFSKLADCIITKGCATPHPSGTRDFTPVEFGQLQTLPLHHHFSGSRNEATRQAGNMVPALMQETILRLCAQTLEAFHHGLISAEDDIEDLDITLIEKGADIPELNPTPTSLLDLTSPPPPHKTRKSPPYRYLTAPKLSDAVPATFSSAFARRVLTHRPAPQARTKRACPGYGLGQDEESESPDSEESETSSVRRRKRRARKTSWTEDEDGNIVIDSD
jgi:DNA (cytosine-5)-methyltransferase 1